MSMRTPTSGRSRASRPMPAAAASHAPHLLFQKPTLSDVTRAARRCRRKLPARPIVETTANSAAESGPLPRTWSERLTIHCSAAIDVTEPTTITPSAGLIAAEVNRRS